MIPRPRLARPARLAPLLLAAVLASCDAGSSADDGRLAPTVGATSGLAELPPGVAFTLDGAPIEVALLERHADALALTRPQDTRDALLRRVIADHVLSRASMATTFDDARPDALARAQALAALVRDGETPDGARSWEGYIDELDPWLRVAFLDAPAGAVLGPVEKSDGGFVVARVTRPFDRAAPVAQVVGLEGWVVTYAEPPLPLPHQGCAGLEARFAERRWRDLVPTAILHALDLGGSDGP